MVAAYTNLFVEQALSARPALARAPAAADRRRGAG